MGKPLVQTFINPQHREAANGILKDALRGVETSNYSLPLTTKDGRVRELLINASTRCDVDGNIVGVVGVAQDVTEQNAGARTAERLVLELQTLIDNANAPIFGIDMDGNVNEWNDAIVNVTGFHREDMLGQKFVDVLIQDKDRAGVHRILSNAMQGASNSNYALILTTKDGKTRQLLLNTSTRRNAMNDVIGVFGVAQDITELRIKEKELERERISAAKNDARIAAEADFSSHLAHEIRNPLSGIDNCSMFLLEALNALGKCTSLDQVFSGNNTMMKDVMQIRSCVFYIQGILNNTLDLSKLGAGKFKLKNSDFDLKSDVIDVAISMLGRNKRSVQVTSTCSEPMRLVGDRLRLQQIVVNLL